MTEEAISLAIAPEDMKAEDVRMVDIKTASQ